MEIHSNEFKQRAHANLANPTLQRALRLVKTKFVPNRAAAVIEFGAFEPLREAGKRIRDRALADLDVYLERFEREATARGAVVHWAPDAAAACRIVTEIARDNAVKKIVKSKSMVSEEVGLNDALEAAGINVVETDLGEYILQLGKEAPSHIVAPVIHKVREEITDLFAAKHGTAPKTDIGALCREAREILRPHFLTADMGISGANFLIAETGSTLIVTNEGNGRMATTLPRVHVAITGIEKVVPTLEDAAVLLRLLPRSATGQAITNYVAINTGTRQSGDTDGPQQFHIVLVDNGRAKLLGGELREMLRCIRCGACMNHCPVYQAVGGHAYGWVYPGPMGAVLTPAYAGIEKTIPLPNAATMCNQCGVVCPVKIPLTQLMRTMREKQMDQGLKPWTERAALRLWGWVAARPALYAFGTRIGARFLKFLGGPDRIIHHLPFASGWTSGRDFPAPVGRTFRDLYKERNK